jgi:DNA-binding XRE family transcriptional regulator
MPDNTEMPVGARLRDVRKRRNLTQNDLATVSGVSLSLIRKLEQGERTDTRIETARRLARALRIPTTGLLANHSQEGADQATTDDWAPVCRALLVTPTDTPEEEPTVEGLRKAVDAAAALSARDQYSELNQVLPVLIRDADTLANVTYEGRRIRAHLMHLTGSALTQMRQFDAAEIALQRSLDGSSDRLDGAATIKTWCWLLLRGGRLAEAREMATRWADDIEPRISRATRDDLAAWGNLLLRVSAAAIRDNRDGEAQDALRFAKAAAEAAGTDFRPAGDFLREFGPVIVHLKDAENAMISDRPNRVLELAARTPKSRAPSPNSLNRHSLDIANAQVKLRQYSDAVATLQRVWESAPQWLRRQQYARDILDRVLGKRRTLTPQMRTLADAIGMPV